MITNLTIEIVHCCDCGMPFGMTNDFKQRRQRDGESFYCPNGHKQHYGDNEVSRLKKKIQDLKDTEEYYSEMVDQLYEQRDKARLSARGQKAAKTRIMNRIKNGVCPCCKRTFSNLHQHMKTEHPELF